jgi:hypothetical protein
MNKENEKIGFAARFKSLFKSVFLFLLTFIIFYGLSLWIFFYFAKRWQLWKLQRITFSILFIIMTFAAYLILSVILTYIIHWHLRYSRASKKKTARVKKYNAWTIVLGLPLAIGVCIVLLYQPFYGKTALDRARYYYSMRGEYPFLPIITETIMTSQDTRTKTAGIKALASIHSKMCLEELSKILQQDKEALNNREVYGAMKKAFISYGLMAKPYLLELFYKYDKEKPLTAEAGAEFYLYSNYFAPPFQRLKKEAEELIRDGQKKRIVLLRIEEIENEVENNLLELEKSAPELKSRLSVHDFILDVFLDMERLAQDKEIYNLAKRVASDTTYSGSTRAKAVMLIAKLGTKKDFYTVAPLLSSSDEIIKTAALSAITRLHKKVGGQKEKK